MLLSTKQVLGVRAGNWWLPIKRGPNYLSTKNRPLQLYLGGSARVACPRNQLSSSWNRRFPDSYRLARKEKASISSNSSQYPFTLKNAATVATCDPFIAIDKRMILGQTLPKCSGFLDDVRIIAAVRSRQCRFERATIPDAERTSELGDQPGVDGDHRPQSGKGSLGETAEQFGVLIDELVNRREKRRSWGRFASFQKIDELLNRLLLLRSQGTDEIGKVLGGHTAFHLVVYRVCWIGVPVKGRTGRLESGLLGTPGYCLIDSKAAVTTLLPTCCEPGADNSNWTGTASPTGVPPGTRTWMADSPA